MKPYLISLAVGLLVGAIYNLLGVKSPAPPTIALIGLLGMLIGEQIIPVAKRIVTGQPVLSFVKNECAPSILGPQAAPKSPKQEDA
ncbi:XapX domain-containing protein [Sphingomonas sp. PR090111-T3T-6A]|uniref:XapX domain-containing protein n=1 Tax=Sphingomonas sp. PR090111-T3T-6A TaxID=685778 RepID=UPI00036794E2|nr:XapX domain-containing protein [Sphingomonas sp. PR090111-T3T-6A]